MLQIYLLFAMMCLLFYIVTISFDDNVLFNIENNAEHFFRNNNFFQGALPRAPTSYLFLTIISQRLFNSLTSFSPIALFVKEYNIYPSFPFKMAS